jgi:alpha-L-rhamnosidase
MIFRALVAAACLATACGAANPALSTHRWSALWIAVPGAPAREFGVYHFRRTLTLAEKPATYVVHVSADNRYELFVNGDRVSEGPARGDLKHWRYETVDLAPHLRAGRNVLAAVVWNFADDAPQAQITDRTGFLLQGDTEAERAADTGKSWKCTRDDAYRPLPVSMAQVRGYFAAGPGEHVDGAKVPWGWETPDFDDSGWAAAVELGHGDPRDAVDGGNRWMLVADSLPPMENKPERIAKLREASGVTPPAAFPAKRIAFEIPPNTHARLLLDQAHLTTAYPELLVSGGRGSRVSIGYAESLMIPGDSHGRWRKGNRDEVAGKQFVGYHDEFLPGGGMHRLFRPLWWRTWRYIEVKIDTAAEPLTFEDLRGVFTAYPFGRKAEMDAGNTEIPRMLDTGWRTARLCAHETYMDCPYYEQLQYGGDTRIQILVSLYMTADARLARNAIALLDDSRTAEGATQSRWPTRLQQYIPPFSLWWIGMMHDYWMYANDPEFVRSRLPGVRAVLSFFAAHQRSGGWLAGLPWWNFVDWASAWPRGVPPLGADGGTAALDLQLVLAYQWAADLERGLGSAARADEDAAQARGLAAAAKERYWDAARGLYADTLEKTSFSQHANALAVLAGLNSPAGARAIMEKVLSDATLTPASLYFRYYLNSAARAAGLGDRYLELLAPWRRMLALGLTTWPETEVNTRSDCHAWSASPNIELFRTVLGIDSAAPGFARVRIEPHPGDLKEASGAMPHPAGTIRVHWKRSGPDGLNAEVSLPEAVTGEFVWRGAARDLPTGNSKVSF